MMQTNFTPKRRASLFRQFIRQWQIQVFALVGIVYLLIFSYVPMFGIVIAFKNYLAESEEACEAAYQAMLDKAEQIGVEKLLESGNAIYEELAPQYAAIADTPM